MPRLLLCLTLVALAGCADPCRDYCETFVSRASECGLGGPTGDDFIDQCADDVGDQFTGAQCDQVNEEIETMSCDDFTARVCEQPDADLAYDCP